MVLLFVALLWMGCDSDNGVVGVDPDATTVEFTSGGGTAVPADSLATINIRINNPAGSAVTVEVLFAQDASSATPEDIGGITVDDPISVTFPANAQDGDTQSVELDVSQADITGGAKEARFALQRAQSDSPVRVGNNRGFDLSIGFPRLADIRGRIGGTFTFQAIVTSIRGSDTSIQDESGGIVVSRNSEFAGEVSVGDQVIITGTISDFDGLRQIDQPDNLDSFDIVSSGNDLPAPLQRTVPQLDNEEDENMRVRVNNLRFTDGRDTFVGGGAAGNFSAEDEDGNSILIRLESSSFYAGRPVPQGTFDFEGVFATFRGTGQLNAHDEGDLILDEDDVPDDDPDDDPDEPDVISIADARELEDDAEVSVIGTISRGEGTEIFFQDDTGGLQAFDFDGWDVSDGDEVRFTGTMSTFNEARQLNVDDLEVLSTGNVVEPQDITIADYVADPESFQGQLIRFEGVTIDADGDEEFAAGGGAGSYDITDGSGETATLRLNDEDNTFWAGQPIPEGSVTVTGPTTVRNNDLRILPIREEDIEEEEEAQVVDIGEARTFEDGTLVEVTGTISRGEGTEIFFQDDTGGLQAFDGGGWDVSDGDEVRFTGTMSTFNEARQLNVDDLEVLSTGNVVEPQDITIADYVADPESFQGQLIRFEGVTIDADGDEEFAAGGGAGSYDITDASGETVTMRFNDEDNTFWAGQPIPEGSVTVTGPATVRFSDLRILPIREVDIEEENGE